jgi:transcriptional regulator with XRE-family HTH domain
MQAQSSVIPSSAQDRVYTPVMRKLSAPRKGIGGRLTDLRLKANLSQKELAERVSVPVANIGFWERTNTPPPSEALLKIAKELDTTAEEILTGQPSRTAKRPGPAGRARETFDQVAKLPRKRQQKILDVVDALLAQQSS